MKDLRFSKTQVLVFFKEKGIKHKSLYEYLKIIYDLFEDKLYSFYKKNRAYE